MATPIKPRRVVAAAGVLSLSLIAPSIVVPDAAERMLPAAVAQTADVFTDRYTTGNFWDTSEAVVDGLTLDLGTTVNPTTNTIFNWKFRNEDGQLILIRPRSAAAFKTGDVDIPVRVTPAAGTSYTTTLKVNVVDEAPAPVDQEKFAGSYTTANFWNQPEAVIEGLTLDPGTKVEPTTNTTFNWNFRNEDGQLILIRPRSATAFRTGNRDIPVRVTEANGAAYVATLKVTVVDQREAKEWEEQLKKTYEIDFEKSTAPKTIEDIELPAGVTLSKGTVAPPPGWGVSVENGKVTVKPASTFAEGYVELPVKVNDGTDSFETDLRINARNPQTSTSDITSGVGKTIGSILGGLLGVPNLGNVLGGVLGGGSGGTGGSGEGNGGGSGRLVNIVVTGNANNNGSPNVIITNNANPVITGNVNDNGSNNGSNNSAVVTNNANPRDNFNNNGNPIITNNANPTVIITGNANPTVDIRDNGSNNASNNTAEIKDNGNPVVTGNANPRDNFNNNGNPVITNNANPTVIITGNANPTVDIRDNGSNNASNNSAEIRDNGNPVVTGNANPTVDIRDNGSNNASNNTAEIKDNGNPVVTGNANPTVIITGNANPTVDIRDNGSNNASNNSAEIKDNGNPVVTGNANPTVGGGLGSALGGSSKRDKGGNAGNAGNAGNGGAAGDGSSSGKSGSSNRSGSSVGADINKTGGLSDPRCVASLAGLGLPLLLAIPVALAQGLNTPGLDQLSGQIAGALNDTARNFGVEPAQVTAVAGGLVGATLAVLGALALASCIPNVESVGLTIGGPKTVTETTTPVATVVTNPKEPTAAA